MKNLFKNSDGTFKVLNCSLFAFIITAIISGLFCIPIFMQDKAEDYTQGNTTTNVQGGELVACKNCDIEFYNKKMSLRVGERVKIKDILNLKDVDLINVEFTFDSKYLTKEQHEGDSYFKANNQLGDVVVTAKYRTYETSMTISITSDSINKATFDKNVYYIYKGSSNKLSITTEPVGASHKLLDLSSADESIVKFDSENRAVGVSTGKTTVSLKNGEDVSTADIYVSINMITVKAKIDGAYKEMDSYKYPNNSDTTNLYIAVKPEDNERQGYTNESISYDIENKGSLSSSISFDSVYSADSSTYIYKVVIKFDSHVIDKENYSLITFKLPDGSIKLFKIYK